MNPLDYVGSPDWRSAVLAVAFAAPWLALLAGKWLKCYWVWAIVAAGALLFPFSIAWVQVPIQAEINALWQSTLPMEAINRYLLLLGVPVIAASGAVQEIVKFGIAVAGLCLMRERQWARSGLALGAASGAGYGGMEAFWVFNQIFASGFTLATLQLAGAEALLGFVERIFAVMFHVGAASLSAYGYTVGRPWRYLFLVIALHGMMNYLVLLLQAKIVSITIVEIGVGLIALATISAALWVRFRPRSDYSS